MDSHQDELPSWGQHAQEWMDEMSVTWRPSYERSVRSTVAQHLMPAFGAVRVDRVDRRAGMQFRTVLATAGDLGPDRVNRIFGLLRAITHEAAERYAFRKPFNDVRTLPTKRPRIDALTKSEVDRFLLAVRPDYQIYYRLRFASGLRSAEVDALACCHIDVDRCLVQVERAVVDGALGPVKNAYAERQVSIPQGVAADLGRLTRGRDARDLIFPTRNRRPRDARSVAKRVWRPTLERAGLPMVTAYSTRHTAASLWLAAGESPLWVARQLGHSDPETLYRRYARYVPSMLPQQGQKAEALWGDAV